VTSTECAPTANAGFAQPPRPRRRAGDNRIKPSTATESVNAIGISMSPRSEQRDQQAPRTGYQPSRCPDRTSSFHSFPAANRKIVRPLPPGDRSVWSRGGTFNTGRPRGEEPARNPGGIRYSRDHFPKEKRKRTTKLHHSLFLTRKWE
jgi:hypothetical protein